MYNYFSCFLSAAGGLVDAGPEYHKALAEEIAKLQRLYGGGDLTSFPEFQFPGVLTLNLFALESLLVSILHRSGSTMLFHDSL